MQTDIFLEKLTTYQDLKNAFHLRWKERIKNNDPFIVSGIDCCLDIDGFDLNASHFGLFEATSLEKKLIGYFRVITPQPTETTAIIQQIAHDNSELLYEYIQKPLSAIFHTIKVFDNSPILNTIYQNWTNKKLNIYEFSRLTVNSTYQHARLSLFLIESAINICDIYQIDGAIISVNVEHQPIYLRYGFKIVAELNNHKIGPFNHSAMTILKKDIPNAIILKCKKRGKQLRVYDPLNKAALKYRND